MKRIEIIANRSVQEELIQTLERSIQPFLYTLLPVVHGRGRSDRKLGTPTWPEENFMLISYLDDGICTSAAAAVDAVKAEFPREGIKFYSMSVD